MENRSVENNANSNESMFQLLLEIALKYINLPLENAPSTIRETLKKMGRFVNADRVYIFSYNFNDNTCSNTYEWCAHGITPEIDNLQQVPIDQIPQWVDAHRAGKPLYFDDVPNLPDSDPVKAILHPQNIKSILTLPMTSEGRLLGFVGFDSVRNYHRYSESEQTLLAVFAQMLVNIEIRLETLNLLLQERDRAEKAARVKSEFVANISHELRTPLNAIMGFADLLTYSQLDNSQRQYLSKIQASSGILLDLINDVLNFSKFEAGKLVIRPAAHSIVAMVDELDSLLVHALDSKSVAFRCAIAPNIPRVLLFDSTRLGQVLNNLLTNAIKFTDEGEVVLSIEVVEQSAQKHRLRFTVKDTGIGISEADLKRIGQAFIQLDSSLTRSKGGTGLGLVITKQLIEQMGGELHIQSVLGEGSAFSFDLWLDESLTQDKTSAANATMQQEGLLLAGLRVLVAEDNSMNQLVIGKMLEHLGAEVTLADDGEQAVAQAKSQPFDLVFMDLQMPVMDGFTATALIKAHDPSLKVIALSAALLDQDQRLAKKAGVDAHFPKPLTFELLHKEIPRWLPKVTTRSQR